MCLVLQVLLPNEVVQCSNLIILTSARVRLAQSVIGAGAKGAIVEMLARCSACELSAACMREWAGWSGMCVITTEVAGPIDMLPPSRGGGSSISLPVPSMAIPICPSVIPCSPPGKQQVVVGRRDLSWFSVDAAMRVHAEEDLCSSKALPGSHLVQIHPIFKGEELSPTLLQLAVFFF